MKMTHSQKFKLATKLQSKAERKAGIGVFVSNNWLTRAMFIAKRVSKQVAAAQKRKEEKKKLVGSKSPTIASGAV